MNLPDLSTINGIDATLALMAVALVVLWLYDRDRWRTRIRVVQEQADRWSKRTIEAQAEQDRLRASVAAEVEARLDAEVEVRLEAAERAQSAHDRVEALAAAVWERLHADGRTDGLSGLTDARAEVEAVHRLLDQLGVPRRDYPLAGRVRHALELEVMLRAQVEQTNRALQAALDVTSVVPSNESSKGAVPWSPDAVTLSGVEPVEEVLP